MSYIFNMHNDIIVETLKYCHSHYIQSKKQLST